MLLDDSFKTKIGEAQIIDVAVTVLDLLGIQKPTALQGVSPFYV